MNNLGLEPIAAGVHPGGAITPGDKIQGSVGCTMVGAGEGTTQVTLDPSIPTLDTERTMCILTPGWGSSPSFGVVYGVSFPSANVFIITTRQADDQSVVDIPFGFVIVQLPKRL